MDLPCSRVDELWKSIDVSTQQLLQTTIVENLLYNLMLVLQAFQHLFAGHILTGFGLLGFIRNFQLVEQDFTHLFGGGDVELHASHLMHFFFDLFHAGGEVSGSFLQCFGVYAYSVSFHVGENRNQWHFNVIEQPLGSVFLEFLFQHLF